jgi:hypothetical protein
MILDALPSGWNQGELNLMSHTHRLYSAAQEAFRVWCRQQGVRFPGTHDQVATYLQTCAKQRGVSTVPVHLSAIARLYRERGKHLDTKAPAIQIVVMMARTAMRDKSLTDSPSTVKETDYRTQIILRPSRDHLPTAFDRLTQVMCDAMRRSHGASTCELCDEPCNNPEAQAAARVAIALGAREMDDRDDLPSGGGDKEDGWAAL